MLSRIGGKRTATTGRSPVNAGASTQMLAMSTAEIEPNAAARAPEDLRLLRSRAGRLPAGNLRLDRGGDVVREDQEPRVANERQPDSPDWLGSLPIGGRVA